MSRLTATHISRSQASKSRARRAGGKRQKRQTDSPVIHPLLQMQQTLGNRAVGRMIQAQLKVSQPGDQFEQEADRVAEQVVNSPGAINSQSTAISGTTQGPSMQRMPEMEDGKNELKNSDEMAVPTISRMPQGEEDKELHKKPVEGKAEEEEMTPTLQAKSTAHTSPSVNPSVANNINRMQGGGKHLPKPVRAYFEPRMRADFSQVRVHADAHAADTAKSINARAFTVGRNIAFGAGEYSPDTNIGRKLLAHELTHVIQQKNYSGKIQKKDTCLNSNSDEALWAGQHEGKVFKSGDNPKEPNEAILWNFCVGETQLREKHQQSLKQEIPRWKGLLTGTSKSPATRPDLRIKLQGTASSSGNKNTNEKIALERARAVKTFLEVEGIPSSFIIIEGVGSQFPLADETSPENMARNRRVELFFFTPTVTADITGALVAANVSKISIGKQSAADPPPVFNKNKNIFSRVHFAMAASADVDLTGFAGDSIGFYQLLTCDQRIGYYISEKDGNDLLLDYGRCNTILPCRDILDATSLFSIDNRSLFLNNTGSVSGTVRISDRPGTGFPIKYPDPTNGPFMLSHYFWKMDFDLILGIRSSSLFMPLQSAAWSLAAAEDVDVKKQKTNGLSPISVHQTFATVSAADKKGELDKAFTGQTCRIMARSREIVPEEKPCKPTEI